MAQARFVLAGRRLLMTALCGCVVSGSACRLGSDLDPRALPERFTEIPSVGWWGERQVGSSVFAMDLTGDGQDELVRRFVPLHDPQLDLAALLIAGHDMEIRGQANFTGELLAPHAADIDGNGRSEILQPVLRGDSLFLSLVDANGDKVGGFLLATGQPREDVDGPILWDPEIVTLEVADLEGDGNLELIVVLFTAYARLPRGVYVYSLPDGQLISHEIVGAAIRQARVADFDGDGVLEVFTAAHRTSNGAIAGGFTDAEKYLILFDLLPEVRVSWQRRLTDPSGNVWFGYGDFGGAGQPEVVILSSSPNDRANALLQFITPGSDEPGPGRVTAEQLFTPQFIDVDRDGRLEIVAASRPSTVVLFDSNLEVLARRDFPQEILGIESTPDLDGDAIPEVFVSSLGGQITLLDADLRPRATAGSGTIRGVARRSISTHPLLLVERPDYTSRLVLQSNPTWWLWRIRFPALWALALFALASGLLGLSTMRAGRRLRRAIDQLLASDPRTALLVIDAKGRALWCDSQLYQWLGRDRLTPSIIRDHAPRLWSWLEPRAHEVPVGPQAIPSQALSDFDRARTGHAQATRLGGRADPHWLIRVGEHDRSASSNDTWASLARRMTHSIRNPLTSMLLTLQRLRLEYRDHAPGVAGRLDRYTSRIEGRVEDLRRLATNFLKLMAPEEARLESLELDGFLIEECERVARSLPPDIDLERRLLADGAWVLADSEQIPFVLDNLVANAVNAMPDGGVLTIATSVVRDVQPVEREGRRDYARVEVLDTGHGVPEEINHSLFEAGVSGRAEGSGLGLAIVKKIAEDLGGFVSHESEPRVGSAFSVFLPVDRAGEDGSPYT